MQKKEESNGQLLDNLINQNTKSKVGIKYPKNPFWQLLDILDNSSI